MSKQSILAIAVFVLLLGGVYLAGQQPAEKGISRVSFASVDPEAIDQLKITGPQAVTLEKVDGKWRVEGKHLASATAVQGALAAIPKIESSELLTTTPERFAHFEVDAETGHTVSASAGGKEVAKFVVGKAAAGGTAIRVGDEVFNVKGVYAYTFARKPEQWFELKLFDTPLAEVTRARLGPADAPYALERGDTGWALAAEPAVALPEGFRFDANAAKNRVSALLNLRAKSLVTEDPGDEATGLGEGATTVSFSADEARTVLRLGKAPADDAMAVFGRVEGGEALYLLHRSNVDALLGPATGLRQLDPMQLDPALVRTLEIDRGKERLVLEKRDGGWAIAEARPPAPEGFDFDPDRVEQRLNALKNTRALGLAEDLDRKAAGLDRPAMTITATFEAGGEAVMAFGEEQETEGQKWVPVTGNIDDAIYRLSTYVKNNLGGGIETFERVPVPSHPGGMPGFDPSMMKELPPEVREALMKKQLEQQRMQNLSAKLPPVSPPPKKQDD